MFAYNVDRAVDLHINGVSSGQARLKRVGIGTGRRIFAYWEFAKMHVSLVQQIRKLQHTESVLQFVVDGLPIATQNGHGIWNPWQKTDQERTYVAFGTTCFELQDQRFQDLCRKFWNT